MFRSRQSALARERAKAEARILAEREVRKGATGTRITHIIVDELASLPSPAPLWRPGAPWTRREK